jgi:hypothetical protein
MGSQLGEVQLRILWQEQLARFSHIEVMAASVVPLGMALCATSRSELFARRGSEELGHENARKVFAKVQA